MVNCRKLVCLALSLQLFFSFAACGLASAEELEGAEEGLPSFPLVLQGDLTVNGAPVSEGSEILAYYGGSPIGSYKVESEGKLNLVLNLAPESYEDFENVEFHINGAKAELELQEADLEAIKNSRSISGPVIEVSASGSVAPSSSSGGSDSSEDAEDAVGVSGRDDPEVAESDGIEAGEYDEDFSVYEETVGAEDTKGGVEYSDDQPVFWVVFFITAILGVVLVMRKMLVG